MLETNTHIGDRFRMDTVEAVVTQPRLAAPGEDLESVFDSLYREHWRSGASQYSFP